MEKQIENQLSFNLFGALALSKNSQPISLPYTETARCLLAYLLLHHPRPQQRAVVAGVFWPDKPEAWTRQRLSQALYQLRRWSPDFVLADTHTIALNPEFPIWVDILSFRQLLAPAPDSQQSTLIARARRSQNLQQAVLLYRSDLLEGFYEDWVLAEREALREMYLQALSDLIDLEKSNGKYSEALAHALQLASVEPLQEAYHREVMRLEFWLQKPDAALKQYALCCQMLEEQLGLQPDAETAALAQEIANRCDKPQARQQDAAPYLPTRTPITWERKNPPTGQLPLIGREAERSQLNAILDEMLDGFGAIALIDGEAGVGKTRLVQELAGDAEWRSAQVLWGRSSESEDSPPYDPLLQALNSGLTPLRKEELTQLMQPIWLSVLAPLLPELGDNQNCSEKAAALPPAQEHDRLFYAFSQLLSAWGEIRPLVLILENIHWLDEDSLDLLSRLGETASQGNILLLCTYRSEEGRAQRGLWEKLQAIHRQPSSRRIHLDRLNAQASGEMIRRALHLSVPVQIFENRLIRETGGNPLFILETLRVLQDEKLLYQDADGNWNTAWDEATQDYSELSLSPVVEQSISRRLKQLPTNGRGLLELAAVAGSVCEVGLLRAASEADPRMLIALLQTLVQRNLLEESQAHYLFSHDKVRQVVYTEMPLDQRTRLHRKFAQALKTLFPKRSAALAYHCTCGEMWSEAVQYHHLAGKEAADVFANQLAWEHYTKALEIVRGEAMIDRDPMGEITFDLLFARSNLAWMKGNTTQQEADMLALLDLAQTLPDPVRKGEALIQQANFLCTAKDEYENANQTAQAALTLAEAHDLHRLAASAWQQMGVAYLRGDHYSQAEQALQKSIILWQSIATESVALAEAFIHLAQVYERTGAIGLAKEQAQKVVILAQQEEMMSTLARAYALLATLDYRENDFKTAIDHNQLALDQARNIGHKHNEAVILCNLGVDYWALGDYAKTIDFTRQGFEIYRQLGNRRGMTLCCDNLSAIYNETGQYAQAQEYIEQGLVISRDIKFPFEEGLLLLNLGRLYLEQNELQSALETCQQALEVAQRIDSPYVTAGAFMGLGIALHTQERYQQAGEHFVLALENYQKAGESAFATGARSFLAICSLSANDLPNAIALSSQAVADLEAAGGGEYVQDIYLHHFLIMSAANRNDEAYQALQKAHQALQERAASLPPDWRDRFLNNVLINQRILQVWRSKRPHIIQMRLPSAIAPGGRPLQEDEWITVKWTISIEADLEMTDKQERRRVRILRLLDEASAQGAAPTITDLAQALNVSAATIKRDLAFLRLAGYKPATRGERSF